VGARARLLAALAALASPWAAWGDDPAARGFDADPYRFAATLDGDFMVETAAAQPVGSWRGELLLQDAVGLIPWKSGNATIGHVVPNRLSAVLQGAYSLGWLELGVDLPLVLRQTSDLGPLTSVGIGPPLAAPIGATRLGDLRLVGKLPILSERRFPIGLSALLDVRIPTGSSEAFTGDGLMAVPGGVASARLGRVRLDLQLGYALRKSGQFLQLVVHDAFAYGLGAREGWSVPPSHAGLLDALADPADPDHGDPIPDAREEVVVDGVGHASRLARRFRPAQTAKDRPYTTGGPSGK